MSMSFWRLSVLITIPVVGLGCYTNSKPSKVEVAEIYAPAYPDFMFMTHREANVSLEVVISPSGKVTEAKLINPLQDDDKWFTAYCQDHETFVRQWRFKPLPAKQKLRVNFVYELLEDTADLYDLGTSFVAPSTVIIRAKRLPTKVYRDPILELYREKK